MEKEVEIFDISYEGAGVGKSNGQIVFVPKTLPGEKVIAEIFKSNKNFLLGRLKKVIKPSNERISAKCIYFDDCGGCDFQHCNYSTEKQIKKTILKRELNKVGFSGDIEFIENINRFSYRNKIKFEVKDNFIGYFKAKSHEFLAIKKCEIADEKINESLLMITKFLQANNFQTLKNVYIKKIDKNLAICFLFNKTSKKILKNIKNLDLLAEFSVFFAFGEVLENDAIEVCCVLGQEVLQKKFLDFSIKMDISAFEQVNDYISKIMYEKILMYVENKRVINAYSGQGLLTLLISQKANFVYGIEIQQSAHQKAEELSAKQPLYKIKNICDSVEHCIDNILIRDKIDLIILDPAREGCQKTVLDKINENNIPQIIYISCNFATLVRDLKILKNFYNIKTVTIFDMFSCTANLETMVILQRKMLN